MRTNLTVFFTVANFYPIFSTSIGNQALGRQQKQTKEVGELASQKSNTEYTFNERANNFISYKSLNTIFDDQRKLKIFIKMIKTIHDDMKVVLDKMLPKKRQILKNELVSYIKNTMLRYNLHYNNVTDRSPETLENPAVFIEASEKCFKAYIESQTRVFREKYGLSDDLFRILFAKMQFDRLREICAQYAWKVPINVIFKVIAQEVLNSYKELELSMIKVNSKSVFTLSKRFILMWRVKAHRYLINNVVISLQEIERKIHEVMNGNGLDKPVGKIVVNRVYDVTSANNRAAKEEKVDSDAVIRIIKKINNVKFNTVRKGVCFSNYAQFEDEIVPISRATVFKCRIGKKIYILKCVEENITSITDNDIIFEELYSPYICKVYGVFYDVIFHIGGSVSRFFWILTEFLEVSPLNIENLEDSMETIRNFFFCILNGLMHLQSQGIVHDDLWLPNIQGEQIETEKGVKYTFKLIDLGRAYNVADAGAITSRVNDSTISEHTPIDVDLFLIIKCLIAKTVSSTNPWSLEYADFLYNCIHETKHRKVNYKKLLMHSFITKEQDLDTFKESRDFYNVGN
ncbi:hypothetical protein GINT2_001801 [Glugoides intestinalis]